MNFKHIYFIDRALGKSFADCQGRVFVLVARNLNREKIIDILSKTMGKIEQFTENNQAPFIAKIYQDYTVKMWRDSVTIFNN